MKKAKPYIISALIALAVGALSALLTKDNMNLSEYLNMPPLSPPDWLFPIVWSILYIMMGISAAIVYLSEDKEKNGALVLYGANLVINFFWSLIFFNIKAYYFAFIWLILLWLVIIAVIYKFLRINKKASYLMIPYLLWVTFAGYLNLAIALLN